MALYSITVLLTTVALTTEAAPTADTDGKCTTSPAVVGSTGTMTFHFRKQLNMSSDTFFTYVKRAGKTASVLQCDRRNAAGITCHMIDDAFNPTSIKNHSLTLTAKSVTPELAGIYTLWTIVGGSQEPPVQCNFTVMNKTGGDPVDSAGSLMSIILPIVFALIAAVIIAVVVVVYKRKKRPEDSAALPMLALDTSHADVEGKRWYFGQMSDEEEAELPLFNRNGPGSFLIRKYNTNSNFLHLAVCGDNRETKHFRIIRTKKGYQIQGAEKNFSKLPKLVVYYQKRNLIVDGNDFGKLAKPFEVHPKEEWYAGRLARRDLEIPLFKGMVEGSFLIRDSITHPGCYTLAVVNRGAIAHYRIRVDENCYEFCDAKTKFKSLHELVRYYQENDIILLADVEHDTKKLTKEENLGKLGSPVPNAEGRDRTHSTIGEQSGLPDVLTVQA